MNRREKLLKWVRLQHKHQLVKKTTIPYIHHLKAVAEMADIIPLGYETGLCHDLLEDTSITIEDLRKALLKLTYSDAETYIIIDGVVELTDLFTTKAYPGWRKAMRKTKEAERMATISPLAQTVKYADLFYNINWMLTYDIIHLRKYLSKKQLLLQNMNRGDQHLLHKVLGYIESIGSAY